VKPELVKLAGHRLARAKAAFSEGDHLMKAKAFMGAVNRFVLRRLLCGPRAFGAARAGLVQAQ
jgi:hypothetical protein